MMNHNMNSKKEEYSSPALLIVEDDLVMQNQIVTYFEKEKFTVFACDNTHDARQLLMKNPEISIVLLDIQLKGEDGIELSKKLRTQSDIGIIIITSKDSDIDKIIGLETGADDYITKPFNFREVLSRVKNLNRRAWSKAINPKNKNIRGFGTWKLDLNKRELIDENGSKQALSSGEYQLLMTFLNNPGKVITRDDLMMQIRNREWMPYDRYPDVLVGQLRKKLGENASNARIITTIHGSGYLFTPSIL